jgi:hypothetical protein
MCFEVMSRMRALVVITVMATACSGMTQQASAATREPQWPQRVLWQENSTEMYAEQVLDQSADVLYTLAPATNPASPVPDVLRAIDLHTRQMRRGASSYQQNGLALASGYLWVYGSNGLWCGLWDGGAGAGQGLRGCAPPRPPRAPHRIPEVTPVTTA